MKKSALRASVLALFLMVALLLTSCAPSYSKMNLSKHVTLEESDYKGLAPEVDRVIISDSDVTKAILGFRYDKKTAATGDYAAQNPVSIYDELGILYEAVDSEGNVVETNITWDRSSTASAAYTLPIGTLLGLGYERHEEGTLLRHLEDLFLTDALKAYDYKVDGRVQTEDEDGKLSNEINLDKTSVVYVGYTSDLTGYSKGFVKLDLTEYDLANPKGNDFNEAIALGLLQLYREGDENKLTVNAKKSKNIYINPADDSIIRTDGSNFLDYTYTDDAGASKTFQISATVYGAFQLNQFDYNATALETTFTYPDDAEGTYSKDGSSTAIKNVEVTVRVYVLAAKSYIYPDYDDAFITETMGFTSADGKTGDALKAEYEASVKNDLQTKENEKADKAATDVILDLFMDKLKDEDFNLPKQKVKAFVRDSMDNLRYEYDTSYKSYFKTFEDFAIKYCYFETATGSLNNGAPQSIYTLYKGNFSTYAKAHKDGVSPLTSESTAGYSLKDVKAELTRQAEAVVKEEVALRRLAEVLNVTFTAEEFSTYVEKLYKQEVPEDSRESITLNYFIEIFGRENFEGALLKTKLDDALFALNKDTVVYKDKTSAGEAISDGE